MSGRTTPVPPPRSLPPPLMALLRRNNLTVVEGLQLAGRGAVPSFEIAGRQPGSVDPVLFEVFLHNLINGLIDSSLSFVAVSQIKEHSVFHHLFKLVNVNIRVCIVFVTI